MNEFLNIGIGKLERTVRVENIEKKSVGMKDGRTSEKIEFTVLDNNNKTFKISDCWVDDVKTGKSIKGLWFTEGAGGLSPASALAKLLKYHNVESLGQLIGKDLAAFPDLNDFLVLTACEMSETEVAKVNTLQPSKTNLFE